MFRGQNFFEEEKNAKILPLSKYFDGIHNFPTNSPTAFPRENVIGSASFLITRRAYDSVPCCRSSLKQNGSSLWGVVGISARSFDSGICAIMAL